MDSFWHNYRIFRAHCRGKTLEEVKISKDYIRLGPLVAFPLVILRGLSAQGGRSGYDL